MIISRSFFYTSLSQLILVVVEIIKIFFLGRYFDSNNFGIYFLILTSSLFFTESIKGYAQILYIDKESDKTILYDTLFKTIIVIAVLSFFVCLIINVNKLFYVYMPILIILYGNSGVYEMNMIKDREFYKLGKLKALGGLISLIPLLFLPYFTTNKIHLIFSSTILLTLPIIVLNFKNYCEFKLTKKFYFKKNGVLRSANILFLLLNTNIEKYVIKLLLGNSALGDYTMAQSVGRKLEQKLNQISNTIVLPMLQDSNKMVSKNKHLIDQILLLSFYFSLSWLFVLMIPSLTDFFFKNNWGNITENSMLFVLIGYLYSYETIIKNKILLNQNTIKDLLNFDIMSFIILTLGLTFILILGSVTLIKMIYILIGFKYLTNVLLSILEFKKTVNSFKSNFIFFLIHIMLSLTFLLLLF
jgi:O-antigen/teichoic acid export membrane protein